MAHLVNYHSTFNHSIGKLRKTLKRFDLFGSFPYILIITYFEIISSPWLLDFVYGKLYPIYISNKSFISALR